MCDNLKQVGECEWTVVPTGETLRLVKEEAPILGHTAGCRSHNWEELCFRKLRLRWSDVCSDSQLCYYCDVATEYTFSLELYDDEAKTQTLIVTSVKNIMDPSKTYVTIDEALLRPWLEALLPALGLEPTAENWTKVATACKLSSFDPKQHH